jgi:ABC-type nitrate/sulfonate/bicarbonate transport system substrate-binding protein
MTAMRRLSVLLVLALCWMSPAMANEPAKLRVNVFAGVQNLPIFAGQARGVFARNGLEIELQFTPNSPAQREGLAKGSFEIAHAGVDNSVALAETGANPIIVMGGDSGMQELFAQPEIASVADLKGRIVAVDAPNTSYAIVARKILRKAGLQEERDYTLKATGGTSQRLGFMKQDKQNAATLLFPPFSIMAARDGFRSLGTAVSHIGPYQGTGCYVLRSWASANAGTLERYIAAYVESLRWVLDPANRGEAAALLAARLKVERDVAEAAYDRAADPVNGLAPDARFNMDGFRNQMALRAEFLGTWGGKPPEPDRYLDLSYYQRVLAKLGGK